MNPDQATPVGNNVLVELQENDTLVYKSLKLILPEYSVPLRQIAYYAGRVISVTEELDGSGFQWTTDIEVQKDDIILFSYTAGVEIKSTDRAYNVDGKLYATISYPLIYLRIREGVIQGVNGYVITEAIKRVSEERNGIVLPKTGNETMFSKVIAISVPNKTYRHHPEINESAIDISVGDIVFHDKWGSAPIEAFSRMFNNEIYANQRRFLKGKLINKNMEYNHDNFALFGESLLVRVLTKEKVTASGIIIPEMTNKRNEVEVIQVGLMVKKGYKKGQKYLLQTNALQSHNQFQFDGEFMYVIPVSEQAIFGVIK
jgi:co-chaperonin GroES (HSP10)